MDKKEELNQKQDGMQEADSYKTIHTSLTWSNLKLSDQQILACLIVSLVLIM